MAWMWITNPSRRADRLSAGGLRRRHRPSTKPVRRTPRPLTGLELAESKLIKGDVDGAGEMAEAALKTDPKNAEAHYLLGRIDLMQGDPDEALDHLTQTVKLSHDPRTIAWAHIYLGRMYDIARDPDNPDAILPQRDKAIAEYRAALANRDSQPDTKAAAEKGIKQPFTLPKRAAASSDQQDDSKAIGSDGQSGKGILSANPAADESLREAAGGVGSGKLRIGCTVGGRIDDAP